MQRDVMQGVISNYIPESIHDQWDIDGLEKALREDLAIDLPINQWLEDDRRLDEESLVERITDEVVQRYRSRREHNKHIFSKIKNFFFYIPVFQ